jgi:phage-related minor tail protein
MATLESISVRRTKIVAETVGVDQATTALNKLATAQDNVAVSSVKSTAATENVTRKFDNLQRAVDPAFRSMQQLERVEKTLAQAREQGLGTVARHNEVLAMARDRYGQATSANDNFGKSTRNSSAHVANLSYQINDIGTMLAMGASPFQVLASQGGQVLQIYQQSPSVFRDMGSAIGGVLTPTRLLAGGALAVGAAVALAYSRWTDHQRELSRALVGTGREAGVTRDQLEQAAEAAARASGGSVAGARGTVAALANTGRVAPGMLSPIAAMGRDLAATLGVEGAEANKLLASSFADPVKGAEELNKQLGGLNERNRQYIASLVASGNTQRAQQVLLDTFAPRLGKAAELTSVWARAWEAVKSGAGGAADAVGRAVDRSITSRSFSDVAAERLKSLEEQSTAKTDGFVLFRTAAATQYEAENRKRVTAELEIQRSAMHAILIAQDTLNLSIGRQATLQSEAATRQRQIDTGTTAARQAGAPDQTVRENVRTEIDLYSQFLTARDAARAKLAAINPPPINPGRSNAGIELAQAEQNLREQERVIRSITANNGESVIGPRGALRENVTEQEGMNRLLEQGLTLRQQDAQLLRVQRAEAQAGSQLATQADKERALRLRAEYDARVQGIRAGDQDRVAAQTDAAVQSSRIDLARQLSQAATQRVQSTQAQVDALKAETAAMGGSVALQERVRSEQQMLTDARREYVRISGNPNAQVPEAEAAAYRKVAEAIGKARQEQTELRVIRDAGFERDQMFRSSANRAAAQAARNVYGEDYLSHLESAVAAAARFNDQLRTTTELAGDFAKGFVSDLVKGKSVMEALSGAASRLGDRLLSMAMDQLIMQLFSSLGGALGGLGGGGVKMGDKFAKGSVFNQGGVTAFANGGVIDRPHVFPFANGTGLMGEAGPEAIMPLRRDSTGRLGVAAAGGGGGAQFAAVLAALANSRSQAPQITVNAPPGSEIRKSTDDRGNATIDILPIVEGAMARNVNQGRGPLIAATAARLGTPQRPTRG